MTTSLPLPARRPDLRIESGIVDGKHVVKDRRSGSMFLIGDEELFLLTQLDGRQDATAVRDAFTARFAEPLLPEDLDAFVSTARERGMLTTSVAPPPRRQHVLYWRKKIWDPSRAFAWLEPRLRFLWTPGFALLSIAAAMFAAIVVWDNRGDMLVSVRQSLHWEGLLLGWCALLLVGLLHESAHGLTCKHYGGEVDDIGVLFMLLMPCFYCNVSDAWLIRSKRQRVLIMLAGVWCNLVLWSLAVLTWRVTQPGTTLHRVAFLVLTLSGIGSLFNLNPLIKLDGYYVLSDWLEVPNLQQRSLDRVAAHLRRLLWGGAPVAPDPRGRLLTVYGLLSWTFAATLLAASIVLVTGWLQVLAGTVGVVFSVLLAIPAMLGLFHGLTRGEVRLMFRKRHSRTLLWLAAIGGLAAALTLIEVDAYVGGSFTVRPRVREEVRGRIAGYLGEIHVREGQHVDAGALIGCIEVPDLDSRLQQKRAELREADAQRQLLESAARPEAIAEQQARVRRLEQWCATGERTLQRAQQAVDAELAAFEQRRTEATIAIGTAEAAQTRVQALFAENAAASKAVEQADEALRIARARLSLVEAERRACEARGTLDAEEELAERQKDLGDERGKLMLLQVGGRPEEIAAQKARAERLAVELQFVERLCARREIHSAVAGRVVTSRLEEKVGSYVHEGDLICCLEATDDQEAEITVDEAKLGWVRTGQTVTFKARALAFDTLYGVVTGIALRADKDQVSEQTSVVVYGSLTRGDGVLRTAMTGHARIHVGRQSLGSIALESVLRLVRTEFWW